MRLKDHFAGRRASQAARLLALAGGGISIYTAWLGGKLVQEMGEPVKPYKHELYEEQRNQEDHGRRRERLAPASPFGARS